MAQNMSIGQIGAERLVYKRQFRWAMYLTNTDGSAFDGDSRMWYLRMANRPTLTVEETEINHLHEKHWISGKPSWDTISMTIYDVKYVDTINSAASASELAIHGWLNRVWQFGDPGAFGQTGYAPFDMGDHDAQYKLNLTIKMLDGHGATMETWWLQGCWPTNVNWGSLDYSSSETADVETTVRFDRAIWFGRDVGVAQGSAGPSD